LLAAGLKDKALQLLAVLINDPFKIHRLMKSLSAI